MAIYNSLKFGTDFGLPKQKVQNMSVDPNVQKTRASVGLSPIQNVSTPLVKSTVTTQKKSKSSGGGGGNGSVTNFSQNADDTQSQLEYLRKKQLEAVGENYNAEMSRLGKEGERAQSMYDQTIQQAQGYFPQFQKLVGDQQASTNTQLDSLENQRKMESDRSLQQARSLLNDLNRRQSARMSATGNYGSSVPDAFAESFGNKAYEAQSQIQQSRDKALTDVNNQRVQAKQYFDQKLFDGQQKYDGLVTGLKQQLNAQLDQIANAKGQAGAAKRAASLEAWNNYVNNKFSLDQELRQYNAQIMNYQNSMMDMSQNTFEDPTASEIDSSGNDQILGDLNTQMGGKQYSQSYSQAPVYAKRKLTPEEQAYYGTSPRSKRRTRGPKQFSDLP